MLFSFRLFFHIIFFFLFFPCSFDFQILCCLRHFHITSSDNIFFLHFLLHFHCLCFSIFYFLIIFFSSYRYAIFNTFSDYCFFIFFISTLLHFLIGLFLFTISVFFLPVSFLRFHWYYFIFFLFFIFSAASSFSAISLHFLLSLISSSLIIFADFSILLSFHLFSRYGFSYRFSLLLFSISLLHFIYFITDDTVIFSHDYFHASLFLISFSFLHFLILCCH